MNVHARPGFDSAVHERFVQGNIRIADLYVFADHADVDHRLGILLGGYHGAPFGQVGGGTSSAACRPRCRPGLFMQQHGNLVDIVGVDRGDDGALLHVGEQCDLAPLFVRQRLGAPAQQDIRLNADAAQFLDRMLRRLGLDFAGAPTTGTNVKCIVQDVIAPELDPHLTDGLEERQRFDIADRAADFDHAYVRIPGAIRTRYLISSVMCGMTCTVAPR